MLAITLNHRCLAISATSIDGTPEIALVNIRIFDELSEESRLSAGISDNVHSVLGSRQSHIKQSTFFGMLKMLTS